MAALSEGRSQRADDGDAALVSDMSDLDPSDMARRVIASASALATTTVAPEQDEKEMAVTTLSPETVPQRLDNDEINKPNPLETNPSEDAVDVNVTTTPANDLDADKEAAPTVVPSSVSTTTSTPAPTSSSSSSPPPAVVDTTVATSAAPDHSGFAEDKVVADSDNRLGVSAEEGKAASNDLVADAPENEDDHVLVKKKEGKKYADADQLLLSPGKDNDKASYKEKLDKKLNKYYNGVDSPTSSPDSELVYGEEATAPAAPSSEVAEEAEAVTDVPKAVESATVSATSSSPSTLETRQSNPMSDMSYHPTVPVVIVSDEDVVETTTATATEASAATAHALVSEARVEATLPLPHTTFSKCAAGQFQCMNGTSREGAYCVPLSSKCDSVNDCSDGSDEAKCMEEGCPGNFQCTNGQCLKRHLVCNSIVDCNDGSDEMNCENWQCHFDEFQCPSKRCIPILSQCDGKPDCENHMDERNCQDSCGNDEYFCPEGWCIPLTQRCDGMLDCANGEDEQLCDCALDQFKCHTGGCVSKANVCDGVDHCPDLSDEWNCIRLHNETSLLQIRNADNEWLPVCGSRWDSQWSDMACQSLGFSGSASTEYQPLNNSYYMILKDDATMVDTMAESHRLSSMLKNVKQTCAEGAVEIQCQEFTCGTHSPSAESLAGRLAGGDGAASGSQPWVAVLYNSHAKSSCTASIISPRWLLVSYNCLHMKDKSLTNKDWIAYAGGSMYDKNTDTQMRPVRSIVPYPQVKYNQLLYSHDIALVELEDSLLLTNKVGAICLPEKGVESQQICVTAGWGFSNPGETNFSQFYLLVPLMDANVCNSTKHYAGKIAEDSICAGFTDTEKSPCYNDEGSPLMCSNENSVWELQGVLSYHSNCGRGHHPSVFSSITDVRFWIERTIGSYFERKTIFNVRR